MGRASAGRAGPISPARPWGLRRTRGGAHALAFLAILLTLASRAAPVSAYWPGAGGEGSGKVRVALLTAPSITSATPGGETVSLAWSAVSAPGSGTVEYYVTRDGGAPAGGCPSSTSPSTVTSCTDTGVAVGKHEYTVTARWRSWTATGAAKSATVVSGPATQLVLEAASSKPVAGEADNVTITAKDASNRIVTSFTGGHMLLFEGAGEARSGTKPIVIDAKGGEKAFGEATELTFSEGKSQVATGKNGVMKLYRSEAATIVVKEGSLSNGSGLAVTVSPGSFKSFSVTAVPAEPEAGAAVELKLAAWDEWHNTITSYVRTNKLRYEGAEASPSGKAAEYSVTTEPTFSAGEVTVTGFRLYNAASTTVKVKEETTGHEGSVTLKVKPAGAKRLAWTGATVSAGTLSSPCLFTCEDSSLGNKHTFKAAVSVTDEYGNIISGLGSGHTVALSTLLGTLSTSELTIASAGNATSTSEFTFTSPSFGSGTATIKAAAKTGTTYTEAEAKMVY
jgi:trimeric autotransporter adhesin